MLSHILCHSSCCRTVNIAQHPKNVDLHLTDFHKGRNYLLELCENKVQCHLWTDSQCSLVSVCYKQRSPQALCVVRHNYIRMILGSARHFFSAGTVQIHCKDSECRSGNIQLCLQRLHRLHRYCVSNILYNIFQWIWRKQILEKPKKNIDIEKRQTVAESISSIDLTSSNSI